MSIKKTNKPLIKPKQTINPEIEKKNLVLQAITCSSQSYSYGMQLKAYKTVGLDCLDYDYDLRKWYREGILELSHGDWYEQYQVPLVKLIDLLRTIEPENLLLIRKINTGLTYRDEYEDLQQEYMNLMEALVLFLHDKPYEELLADIDWRFLFNNARGFEVMRYLARQNVCIPFVQHYDKELLMWLYFNDVMIKWSTLDMSDDMEQVRQVFIENTLLSDEYRQKMKDAYLFYVETMRSGKIDESLSNMKVGGYRYRILHGIKQLHDGKPLECYLELSAILKEHKELVFESAWPNTVYAIAIGLCKDPKAAKTGEKILKSKQVLGYRCCYPMILALHHYLRGDATEYYHSNSLSKDDELMTSLMAVMFIKHNHINNIKLFFDYLERFVAESDYTYLKLLYSDDFDKLKPLQEQLFKQTGLTGTFMPKVKKMQTWEKVIDQIMKRSGGAEVNAKKKQAQELEMERVIYLVGMKNYTVQPKVQKSKDGGMTWTRGRNIALKNFAQEPYLNAQDRKVASLVESDGYYNSPYYELSGKKVIAALIGCPVVYNIVGEQKIDIVEEPLQLQVQETSAGYKVSTNVDLKQLESSKYSVTKQGDKQLTVTQATENQIETLNLLNKVDLFPKESKKLLTELLKTLSVDFTVMSPLLKNATDIKRVDANPLIAVQIAPYKDQLFSIHLAVKPFGDKPPYQKPGLGMEIVSTTIDGERVQTERDLKAELANLDAVNTMLGDSGEGEDADGSRLLDTAECLSLLDQVRQHPDKAYVEWPQGVKMRVVRPMITPEMLKLRISSAGQWFEIEGDVNIGDKEKIKVATLLELLRSAEGNFIRLEGDEYMALSEKLRRQLQALDKMLIGRSSKQLKVATMNGMQLADLEELGVKVKADEDFRNLMKRIDEAGTKQFKLPANIHAELRPYQQEGYLWMSRLAHWGAGACLADDMGLGKTLQSITLMQSRAALGPQLVLMPTSVLLGWQQELQRFAPALTVKVLNQGADRKQTIEEAEPGDVILSTYGLLVTETELLTSRTWTTIVLDEAHSIKNRDTQTSKGAMMLKGDFRLLLTGTPLQNHLSEIWNLFQFANPGLLGTYQQFTDRFILPIERDHDQERQRLLRRILSPFMLRRTKEDVLSELPEKTEITITVELSKEEQALYDNLRQQAIANLEEGSRTTLQTLAEITKLRQAACHPRLINDKLPIPSSKTQAFMDLVASLRQSNHRALVFSQFTSHLALVREELDRAQVPYLYLDGSTTALERNRLVKQFQTGDEPLFLISLKAGGLGLNLTAADYVIHLDPWWNPAIEDQASDRAHRIGQQRPVTVYRLISAGTIEEKIIRLHQNKRSMADALLQDANLFTQLTADDVLRLLRETNN